MLVSNGVVINAVEALANFVTPAGMTAVASATAAIGDLYDGTNFTRPAPPAPTKTQLIAYVTTKQQNILAAGVTVNVAASGAPAVEILCDGTSSTRADLALLALFGQANPTGTKIWTDNNGVDTSVTGTELIALATIVGNWISSIYPFASGLVGQVNSGAVTTFVEVDAAAWPTAS